MISLRCSNPARNVDRVYRLALERNLFGGVSVLVQWGRRGAALRERAIPFESGEEAVREMRRLLKRRRSAPRRLGARYELVSATRSETTSVG